MSMMFPTSFWYEERFDKMVEQQRGMPQVAQEHGLGYIYFDRAAKGNLPDGVQARIRKSFDSMREIRPVFTSGEAVLYEIR
jgi:hypothetical protein